MVCYLRLVDNKSIETQLVEIWQESFGDSEAYIRNFLQKNAEHIQVLAYVEDNRIVSVAYLLPLYCITEDGTEMDCYYLYAAATRKAYRGRGYFGQILQYVNEHILPNVILVPATETLIEYYSQHGFYLWLTEKIAEVAKTEKNGALELKDIFDFSTKDAFATQIHAKAYCDFRKKHLIHKGGMIWNDKMMSYICEEHQNSGGEFWEVRIKETQICFMCRKEADFLYIVEVLGEKRYYSVEDAVASNSTTQTLKSVIQFLMHNILCNKATVCLQPPVMTNRPIYEDEVGKFYFNLTMG